MDLDNFDHIEVSYALAVLGVRTEVEAARVLDVAPLVLADGVRSEIVGVFGPAELVDRSPAAVASVLATPCPTCGAGAGRGCWSVGAAAPWSVHIARGALAGVPS